MNVIRSKRAVLLLSCLLLNGLQPEKISATTFVALGHVRFLTPEHEGVLDKLAEQINRDNPDYVCILGDLTFSGTEEEWQVMDRFLDKIKAKVIFSPGNHDYLGWHLEKEEDIALVREQYLKRAGYWQKVFAGDDCNFVMCNFVSSNSDLEELKGFLKASLDSLDNSKPTILMMHSPIWMHTYNWNSIIPIIQDKVKYVFWGDSKPTLGRSSDYVYFATVKDGIEIYSCGMRNHVYEGITYVFGRIIENKLFVEPRRIYIESNGIRERVNLVAKKTFQRMQLTVTQLSILVASVSFVFGLALSSLKKYLRVK